MGCEDKSRTCCLSDVLRKILVLQKQDFDNESYSGCDKPFLGPVCNSICYNACTARRYRSMLFQQQTVCLCGLSFGNGNLSRRHEQHYFCTNKNAE